MLERLDASRLERFNRCVIDGAVRSSDFASLMDFARLPKRRNSLLGNVQEVINQPIWDTVSFAAAAAMAKTVMFQTPIGQSSKTLAQTYMTKAGQLEQPQKLVIRAIGVYIANNT